VALIHLVYASAASRSLSKQELLDLLKLARDRNAAREITGMLLYADGTFFQVLEGEEDVVMPLFDHICTDPRHARVLTVVKEVISARSFADWSMGFRELKTSEIRDLVGFSSALHAGDALMQIDAGRARKLLTAFKEGRWRLNVA
jgi:hypothetical protein